MISEISEQELKHLTNYILSARKHKHPDSQIRETLLAQGWTDTALDQAFIHANKHIPTKKPKPTREIPYTLIISIIIFLALTSTAFALTRGASTVSDFQEAFETNQHAIFYEPHSEYAQLLTSILNQTQTIELLAKQSDDLETLMDGQQTKTTYHTVPTKIQSNEYATTYKEVRVTYNRKQTHKRVHYLHVQPKSILEKDVALIIGQTLVLDELSGDITFGLVKTLSGWKMDDEITRFSVSTQGAVNIDTNGKSIVIEPNENPLIDINAATHITIYDYDKQQTYCQEELESVQTNTTTYLRADCEIQKTLPNMYVFRYELEVDNQTIDGLALINH